MLVHNVQKEMKNAKDLDERLIKSIAGMNRKALLVNEDEDKAEEVQQLAKAHSDNLGEINAGLLKMKHYLGLMSRMLTPLTMDIPTIKCPHCQYQLANHEVQEIELYFETTSVCPKCEGCFKINRKIKTEYSTDTIAEDKEKKQ